LRNRFYIGQVAFRGQLCPAEHPPILDRDLFEAVQLKLAEQHNGYRAARASREAPLTGRIFDDRGNRMSPSHSRKGGAPPRSSAAFPRASQPPGSTASPHDFGAPFSVHCHGGAGFHAAPRAHRVEVACRLTLRPGDKLPMRLSSLARRPRWLPALRPAIA
jgi:hypothetical protein